MVYSDSESDEDGPPASLAASISDRIAAVSSAHRSLDDGAAENETCLDENLDPKIAAFVTKTFPDVQSLTNIGPYINKLQTKMRRMTDEMVHGVMSVSKAHHDIAAAGSRIRELRERFANLKARCEEAELSTGVFITELRPLECAKRALADEVNTLLRVRFLLQASVLLKGFAEQVDYRQAAVYLEATNQVLGRLVGYADIAELARIREAVAEVRTILRRQIFDQFSTYVAMPGDGQQLGRLQEACKVVEALGPDARKDLVTWFCRLQLEGYTHGEFAAGGQFATLEATERRFAWMRGQLAELERRFGGLFPAGWGVAEALCAEFCSLTRKTLQLLLDSRREQADSDGAILFAMQKTIEFEKELAARFGQGEHAAGRPPELQATPALAPAPQQAPPRARRTPGTPREPRAQAAMVPVQRGVEEGASPPPRAGASPAGRGGEGAPWPEEPPWQEEVVDLGWRFGMEARRPDPVSPPAADVAQLEARPPAPPAHPPRFLGLISQCFERYVDVSPGQLSAVLSEAQEEGGVAAGPAETAAARRRALQVRLEQLYARFRGVEETQRVALPPGDLYLNDEHLSAAAYEHLVLCTELMGADAEADRVCGAVRVNAGITLREHQRIVARLKLRPLSPDTNRRVPSLNALRPHLHYRFMLLKSRRPADFDKKSEFKAWQDRQIALFANGLLWAVRRSGASDFKIKKRDMTGEEVKGRLGQLMQQLKELPFKASGELDEEGYAGTLREVDSFVQQLYRALDRAAGDDGTPAQKYTLPIPYPINLQLYERLVRSCYAREDAVAAPPEEPALLEALAAVRPHLAVTPFMHELCVLVCLWRHYARQQPGRAGHAAALAALKKAVVLNLPRRPANDPERAYMTGALCAVREFFATRLADALRYFGAGEGATLAKELEVYILLKRLMDAAGLAAPLPSDGSLALPAPPSPPPPPSPRPAGSSARPSPPPFSLAPEPRAPTPRPTPGPAPRRPPSRRAGAAAQRPAGDPQRLQEGAGAGRGAGTVAEEAGWGTVEREEEDAAEVAMLLVSTVAKEYERTTAQAKRPVEMEGLLALADHLRATAAAQIAEIAHAYNRWGCRCGAGGAEGAGAGGAARGAGGACGCRWAVQVALEELSRLFAGDCHRSLQARRALDPVAQRLLHHLKELQAHLAALGAFPGPRAALLLELSRLYGPLLSEWLQLQHVAFSACLERCLAMETWRPVDENLMISASVMDLFAMFAQTVPFVYDLGIPLPPECISTLALSIDGIMQKYAMHVLRSCGPRSALMPAAGTGSRLKEAASAVMRALKSEKAAERDPAAAARSLAALHELLTKLNNLHFARESILSLEQDMRKKWLLLFPAEGAPPPALDEKLFDGCLLSLESTTDELVKFIGAKVVYVDLRPVFYEALYVPSPGEDKRGVAPVLDALSPLLSAIRDHVKDELVQILTLHGILKAQVDCLVKILMECPNRQFSEKDYDALAEDLKTVEEFWVARDADGKVCGLEEPDVASRTKVVHKTLNTLFQPTTRELIALFPTLPEVSYSPHEPMTKRNVAKVLARRKDPAAREFAKALEAMPRPAAPAPGAPLPPGPSLQSAGSANSSVHGP
eukprot:tig00001093_g6891.t1